MSTLQIILAILIPVASGLAIMIIVHFCKKFLAFSKHVNQAFNDITQMRSGGNLRKRENRLLFKGILTIFDVLEGKSINGDIKELRKHYEKYLREEAIK